MLRTWSGISAVLAGIFLAGGCAPMSRDAAMQAPPSDVRQVETGQERDEGPLRSVAESQRRWTGVTVSREGRMFVNFPRWSDDVPVSVAEVSGQGELRPFPNSEWNRWEPSLDPATHFVSVQSVFIDNRNRLWILDPANPKFAGVVPGGPKLVEVDLGSGEVRRTLLFPPDVAPTNSYLNDVRIDTGREKAYITDSGSGALIVVDLTTGRSRRLLADHPSTKSEGITLNIGGQPWLRDGKAPDIHADGIALSPDREYLYYQALTGRHLYRIPTRWLRHEYLSPGELGEKVERVGETGAADGILFGPEGNLYLTALESDAIRRLTPEGKLETVVQDERLRWPDSLAWTPEGDLVVTTSQIHLGDNPPQPYRIYRLTPQ